MGDPSHFYNIMLSTYIALICSLEIALVYIVIKITIWVVKLIESTVSIYTSGQMTEVFSASS